MPGGLHPPIEVLKEWAARDHSHIETRGWGLVVVTLLMSLLTFATLVARLWARLVIQRNAGLDDLIITIAAVPTFGLAVAICLAGRIYGFDRHAWDLTPADAIKTRKVAMAIEALYIMCTGLIKISILLFYRRMSEGSVTPVFRWAVRACIAFVIAYIITFEVTLFLGCRPISVFWNQVNPFWVHEHPDFKCFNEAANLLAASAFSIIQDFIACGMPLILFWKLQLPFRQKVVLAAIFGVGFFTCITSIIRIVYIYRLFYVTYDVTWVAGEIWLWTGVEAHVAIICASAPALKAFFRQYFSASALYSWRQKTGTTSSSAIKKDVELGTIEVTREFDVSATPVSRHSSQERLAASSSQARW
ncbi:integral membrane protein [Trichodelitschia bisporula]|uniref:Integral membrane protein n=1 Tax=Trichodelitschia bisporula TaxID=703511 RepID=A0A6G1HVX7_9PEZI|nr:integral membrane protein [Trichodelitschia bisporula]